MVENSHLPDWEQNHLNNTNCFAFSHTIIRPQLSTLLRLRGMLPYPTFDEQCHAAD